MAGRPLATAFVKIRPDFSVFRKETDTELRTTTTSAGRAGDQAGRTYGTRMGAGLKKGSAPGLAAFQKDLERLTSRVNLARVGVEGDKEATLKIDRLAVKLGELDRKVVDPKFKTEGMAKMVVEAAAVDVALDKMAGSADDTGRSALGLGANIGKLSNFALPALIGAGVALSPVLITLGFGLAGFGAAAVGVVKPIADAAAKTGGLRANLATLDPVQQQLARGILSLGTEYKAFSKSLEPEVVTAFNTALRIGGNVLHDVQPLAKATGRAFDGFLGQFGATLQDPQWQQFWRFMQATAPQDMHLLGNVIIDLTNTLPTLLEDLQPIAVALLDVTDGAVKATGALATLVARAEKPNRNSIIGELQNLKPVSFVANAWSEWVNHIGVESDAAAPKLSAVNHQLSIQQQAASEAAFQVSALDSAWTSLLGLFSSQQAITNATTQVHTFAKDVEKSGSNTAIAKADFLNAATAIAQLGQSLQNAHAPAATIYADLQRQITTLRKSGPLTQQQSDDLTRLQHAANLAANSTVGWNTATKNAAKTLENSMLPDLNRLHANTPVVRRDIQNMTDAIVNTGTKSRATHADRAALIADLKGAGLTSKQAHDLVQQLINKIAQLHGKTVNVGLHGSASGGVHFKESISPGSGNLFFNTAARGMLVRGGVPGRDSVPILAQRDELVVPTKMVAAGLVDHLRGKIPGFASGGLVGAGNAVSRLVPTAAANESRFGLHALTEFTTAAIDHMKKAAVQQLAVSSAGPSGGDPGVNYRIARSMFPWPSSMWPSYVYLENREAGFNRFARNPSSGAYGIPQALPPSKLPFSGQAAGGSHAGPQISWMYAYIRGRYGNPVNAASHERAFNWYGSGTLNARPGWAWVGERGRELVNFAGGEQVYPSRSPAAAAASGGGAGDVRALAGAIARLERSLTRALASNAEATGAATARALNGVARSAAKR